MQQKKTLFVTGAASGIGRETARLFASRGFAVGAFDLDQNGLSTLEAELGAGHHFDRLDVTDAEAYARAMAAFEQKLGGRLDVLFNCAGVMQMGRFEGIALRHHHLTIGVNITGVVNGVYAGLPLLKKTPGAHVVTMCSASAVYGVPELATYSASKFFVRGFTEALNLELAQDDITVTDLMPSYVATPMVVSQTYQAGTLKSMGVKLTPRDIAELVWKAAHGGRVHWKPGLQLKFLSYVGAVFPFANRIVMRQLARL